MAEGGTVIDAAGLSYHPSYNPKNMDCDYVLLRLREPYTVDPIARTIPMVESGVEVAEGTKCTASGWGTTMGTGSNETLRAVQVPIVNHEVCRKNYAASRLNVTENMLCAGYDDGMQDSCTVRLDNFEVVKSDIITSFSIPRVTLVVHWCAMGSW